MKIAIIISAKKNTGSISVFKDLIDEFLDEPDLKIDLFYFDSSDDLEFKCTNSKIKLFGSLSSYNYDIVHSTGIRPDLFVCLNRFKFPKNTKFLTTIHSYIETDLGNSYGWLRGKIFSNIWFWILKRFDLIVVLTENAKYYYLDKISNHIEVINNGRSELDFHQIENLDLKRLSEFKSKYFLIGTHAKVSRIKGLDAVIKALVILKDCAFIIIGDGPELENLLSLAKSLNVHDRCLFLGYRKNIRSYFSYYDIYTMPSLSEGMPMALLEAISSRVPCLTSDIEPFKEIFSEKEVVKFALGETNKFVDAINRLRDIPLRNSLVDAAYRRYQLCYTADVMAKNYKKIYFSLMMK